MGQTVPRNRDIMRVLSSGVAVVEDFRIANWLIERQLNAVSRFGKTVHLEPKLMDVLACLARSGGEPVTKEELLQTVWPNTFVSDDVLKRAISELRRVFEDDAHEPRIIQTIPKRGYRLMVPVEPVNEEQNATAALASRNKSGAMRDWRTPALASSLATLLLVLLLGGYILRERFGARAASRQIRSIAVLPLDNLSGDPAEDYLPEAMTDALITDLAQIGSVKVISRTSSMQYKQTKKSLSEVAQELDVDGVIEGTVQRSGNRVRITAQLIEARSDKHLWAGSYEQDLRDVFALEREVTADIARQVRERLTPPTQSLVRRSQPANPKALEAYLQATYHLNRYGRGSGEQEKREAAEYFQQAIDLDSNFVLAYIGLASAHDDLPVSSREDREIERKAAEKALTLDPNSSEAVRMLSNLRWEIDFDWAGAEKGYRQAIGLNPNNAEVRQQFCMLLAEMGRWEEASRECQVAQELDPGNAHLPFVLYWQGEYDRAIVMLRMMIERHPDDGAQRYLLFECYAQKANYGDSIKELEKTLALYGLTAEASSLHRTFERSGFRAALREFANDVERLQVAGKFFLPVNLADLYAILGQKDRAFFWLERAYQDREQVSTGEPVDFIMVDPLLGQLRSDPRFKDLVRRIGLPP